MFEAFGEARVEPGTAFAPIIGPGRPDMPCEHYGRTVGRDNWVRFEGKRLQIPVQAHRCLFIKTRVRANHYPNGRPSGVPRAAPSSPSTIPMVAWWPTPHRQARPPRLQPYGSMRSPVELWTSPADRRHMIQANYRTTRVLQDRTVPFGVNTTTCALVSPRMTFKCSV